MATTKKVWLNAIVAIALVSIIGLGSAFKISKTHVKADRAPITWYYNSSSTSESQFKTASNWSQINDPDDKECFSSGNRPCQVTVDADDNAEMQAYLTGLGSTSVLSVSTSRKP